MIGKPPSWSCAPADLRHWLICLVEGLHAQLTQVLKLAQPAPRSPGAAPQYRRIRLGSFAWLRDCTPDERKYRN